MKFTDLINEAERREPFEVLVDGRWVLCVIREIATYGGRKPDVGGDITFAVLHLIHRGVTTTYGVQNDIRLGAGDVEVRVRRPLGGRTLTPDEVDRYIGTGVVNRTVSVDKDLLDALARTAKAVGNYPAELEKLRGQIKSLQDDRDAYRKQALERAEVLAEIGDTLRATGFAKSNTKYTETIKALNAQRESDSRNYTRVYAELAKAQQELQIEKTTRRQFARQVASALGMITLEPADLNWPAESDVIRKARNSHPPIFAWKSPTQYQREIDELKGELLRMTAAHDRARAEFGHAATTLDAEASKHVIRRKEAEDTLAREQEISKSLAEANARLRSLTVNWRANIPVEVFKEIGNVRDAIRSHGGRTNPVWQGYLDQWEAWLAAATKSLRGDK